MNVPDTTLAAALAAVGLPKLKVIADADDLAVLEQKPGCTVTFADAVLHALEAFLGDGRGSGQSQDSALQIVRSEPESFGLDPEPSDAQISGVLRRILADDPQARLVLLTPATVSQEDYRFLPEYGESIAENWVFRIIAPNGWPFLQWAIVDLRGERAAYSYGFD